MELSGPLGFGGARIQQSGEQLRITTGDGIAFSGDAARSELATLLGFDPPLTSLRYWVLGRGRSARECGRAHAGCRAATGQPAAGGLADSYDAYMPVQRQWLPRRLTVTHDQLAICDWSSMPGSSEGVRLKAFNRDLLGCAGGRRRPSSTCSCTSRTLSGWLPRAADRLSAHRSLRSHRARGARGWTHRAVHGAGGGPAAHDLTVRAARLLQRHTGVHRGARRARGQTYSHRRGPGRRQLRCRHGAAGSECAVGHAAAARGAGARWD